MFAYESRERERGGEKVKEEDEKKKKQIATPPQPNAFVPFFVQLTNYLVAHERINVLISFRHSS